MVDSPLSRYQRDLQRADFVADPAQREAVELLEDLHRRLCQRANSKSGRGWRKLFRTSKSISEPEIGLYFWGGVGRGKTYLMDNFYESLPFDGKMRSHFHRFMREVHARLRELKNQKNPLQIVADDIASKTLVICFDEFFVSDIADAMLLGKLFEYLFQRGVSLVATSNIVPDRLYENGLQRERFLPAIAMLNRYTRVVNVDNGVDYRLRTLEKVPLYHLPLGPTAETELQTLFEQLVPASGEIQRDVGLEIENRIIRAKAVAEDVVWFEFKAICDGPRSQNDYIEIAREYHEVLISNVPQLGLEIDDQARRFISLVDEFYDRSVKLIMSVAVPLEEIYTRGRLSFEIERTKSRLLEMQSKEYLARPHKP